MLLFGGASLLPFTDDFNRSDGALGNGWTGATWTVATNKAVNTPTLGSELFLTGDFAADASWTKGTGWTIAAGVANHAAGTASNLTQNVGAVGSWYRVVWTLATWVAQNFAARFGASNGNAFAAAASYTHSGRNTSSALLGISAINAGSDGSIDNVSGKLLTLSTLFITKDFGRNDVDASVKATIVSGNACGLVLNLDSTSSPANFVIASHDGVTAKLDKCVAGTYTNLISASATYSAGAAIRVTKTGTTYALYYNGVKIGADQSVSDISVVSNTMAGMFQTYELNTLDDFSILAN